MSDAVTIVFLSKAHECPRALRTQQFMQSAGLAVRMVGSDSDDGVRFRAQGLLARAINLLLLLCGAYRTYLTRRLEIRARAVDSPWIICHDVLLLPWVCSQSARVLFDAREYYPRQFEDVWYWKWTQGRLLDWVLRTYLPQVERVTTVSEGLAEAYADQYGVQCTVVHGLPPYEGLQKSATEHPVRLVYAGNSNHNRQLALLCHAVDGLKNVQLDMLVTETDSATLGALEALAGTMDNVTLLPPVSIEALVPTLSSYDVGLFVCPPVTFNLRHSMPNKLFEYVRAGLAIVVSPLPEIKQFVELHGCGWVTADASVGALKTVLESLSLEGIDAAKQASATYSNNQRENSIGHQMLTLIG